MPIELAAQWSGNNTNRIWDTFGAADIYGPTEKNPHWLIVTTPDGDKPCRASEWIVLTERGFDVLADRDPQIRAYLESKPRAWHAWYARHFGYFWAPCPLCGEYFGGQEWRSVDGKTSVIPDPDYPPGSGRGTGICPACTKAGRGYDEPITGEDEWRMQHGKAAP